MGTRRYRRFRFQYGKAHKKTAFRLEHRFAYKKLQLFFSERQRRTRIFCFEYLIKIRNRGETDIRTTGQYRIVCVRQRMCGEGEPLVIEIIG